MEGGGQKGGPDEGEETMFCFCFCFFDFFWVEKNGLELTKLALMCLMKGPNADVT